VTGAATMMLVERGPLRLDQHVADVIPEWKAPHVAADSTKGLDARPASRAITIRHLLTHTSGFGDWVPTAGAGPVTIAYRERGITPGNRGARLNRPGYGPQAKDLDDMVGRLATVPLATEPGTAFEYSSVGYGVLGAVIERVSRQSLDAFCRERIFEPLRMTSTTFQVPRDQRARLTSNYDFTSNGLSVTDAAESSAWLERPTLLDAGGGLISTARDFGRFCTMLVNGGALDGVQVLRPDTARLACSDLMPPDIERDTGYGAGVYVALSGGGANYGGVGTVRHGGATGTLWVGDPAQRSVLLLMMQTMPPVPKREADLTAAIDIDLG
jgi:CubicO group peptidase (beta-lactamase class C family)